MAALLEYEKRRLIAEKGHVTADDFRQAWDAAWQVMVLERAYAHATVHRRSARRALASTRPEFRAAFLDEPTAFATAIARLQVAANNLCLDLCADQTTAAFLAAIAYVDEPCELADAA